MKSDSKIFRTTFRINNIVNFIITLLLLLILISKLSFKFIPGVPYSIFPMVFQYGLHPFVNVGIQLISFIILFFIWIKSKSRSKLSKPYFYFISSLIFLLTVQTFFQILIINVKVSPLLQFSGLFMAIILIMLYGVIIPSLFSAERFIKIFGNLAAVIVVLSVLSLPLFSGFMFRGGRFVGFFKHIPHMVSASTAAFIFLIIRPFKNRISSWRDNILLDVLLLVLLLVAVLITFTKAAYITVLITIFTAIIFLAHGKKYSKLFKFSFLALFFLLVTLLGAPLTELAYEYSSGQKSIGSRPAQDGIQTRTEEIYRGLQYFEKSPHFGNGLMYKYISPSDGSVDVNSYNSFKDPHNFFVSAAVIGGWPLVVMATIAYVLMFVAVHRGLKSHHSHQKILAIFLLSHLPVFFIYHLNFSLGGIGDRLYWLIFGYLGLRQLPSTEN